MAESLYTTCSRCAAVFAVTLEQLQVANGAVRCGVCGETFNARLSLREVPFEEDEDASPPAADAEADQADALPGAVPPPPAPDRAPAAQSAAAQAAGSRDAAAGEASSGRMAPDLAGQAPREAASSGRLAASATAAEPSARDTGASAARAGPSSTTDDGVPRWNDDAPAWEQDEDEDTRWNLQWPSDDDDDTDPWPAADMAPPRPPAAPHHPEDSARPRDADGLGAETFPAAGDDGDVADRAEATGAARVGEAGAAGPGGHGARGGLPAAADDTDPAVLLGGTAPRRRSWRSTLAWSLAAALLATTALAQATVYWRHELLQVPWINPHLIALNERLDRPFTLHYDPRRYRFLQRPRLLVPNDVSPSRLAQAGIEAGGAEDARRSLLEVQAEFANVAAVPQPLPHLRLVLEDRWGRPVAARTIPPQEYLVDERPREQLLAPGERVVAVATVAARDITPEAFTLDICLPWNARTLDCRRRGTDGQGTN